MGIFIEATSLPGGGDGFLQMLFLLVAYGYLLYTGCKMISEGAELLLLVPAYAGIVGSVILPVLGAVPDGAIVLFSGLGDNAQEQLSVGVGALAGSTVMLLTVPWALSVIAGRVNIGPNGPMYKRDPSDSSTGRHHKLHPPNNKSLTGTGVSCDPSVRKNGLVMLCSAVAYVFIQGPAFYYLKHDKTDNQVSKDEQGWAIAGFCVCLLGFIGYLAMEFIHNTHSEATERVAIEVSLREIEQGNVSLLVAMAAVLESHESERVSAPLADPLMDSKGALMRRLKQVLRPFFNRYDVDGSDALSLGELRPLLRDLGEDPTEEELVAYFKRHDADASGSIDYNEFVSAIANYLISNSNRVRGQHRKPRDTEMAPTVPPKAAPSQSDANEDSDEEEADVPEDISSLPPEKQQAAIKRRAAWMLAVGTILVLAFSDPMVDVFSSLGERTNIPAFYISFVLGPLASNLSEVLASYTFALKKTEKTISIAFVQLEGAAIMNNTFCLAIFLGLIAFRKLEWTFSAETITILAVEIVMFLFSMKKVHRLADGLIVLMLYPISIALVWGLEKANIN